MSPARTRAARTMAVAQREFQTVLRSRTVAALAAGYVGLVVGLTLLSAPGGYLPAVLDLLLPHEVLVPVLAFALGYRAVLGDHERGEVEVIRTFPVSAGEYVLGVYLGRLVPLLGVVLLSLVGVGLAVATAGGGETVSVIAVHDTVDTPVVFLRFVVVTTLFAAVALALAVLVSTVARSTRAGLALATGLVLALAVGFDSSLVAALSGGLVSASDLTALLALSPNAAYRSLVFSLAVAPTGASELPVAAATLPSLVGLVAWFGVSLAAAVAVVFRS